MKKKLSFVYEEDKYGRNFFRKILSTCQYTNNCLACVFVEECSELKKKVLNGKVFKNNYHEVENNVRE